MPSLGFAETAEAIFQYGPKKFRSFSGWARSEDIQFLIYYRSNQSNKYLQSTIHTIDIIFQSIC